jgi:hypothetical protein
MSYGYCDDDEVAILSVPTFFFFLNLFFLSNTLPFFLSLFALFFCSTVSELFNCSTADSSVPDSLYAGSCKAGLAWMGMN